MKCFQLSCRGRLKLRDKIVVYGVVPRANILYLCPSQLEVGLCQDARRLMQRSCIELESGLVLGILTA